jgi:hypothetical protein
LFKLFWLGCYDKKINKLQISKFQIPNSYNFVNVCGRDYAALNSLFGGGLDVGGSILGSMGSH